MLRLDDIALFVRTAELGSLSAAARELDCSPAVASAALKRLEAQLQVRLLPRSTLQAGRFAGRHSVRHERPV